MLKTGETYKGRGGSNRIYLTPEEEKNIFDRAFQIINSGQTFDRKIMKTLFEEEFEIIKVNFPDKSSMIDKLIKNPAKFQGFRERFMKKHRLKRDFPEDLRERNYECDICFKKFTFKNSMIGHRKTVHSFLF